MNYLINECENGGSLQTWWEEVEVNEEEERQVQVAPMS
jgi:hypothetical protein